MCCVVNEGQKLSECRVSLVEESSIFDGGWFSMKSAVLEGAAIYTARIIHVDNDSETTYIKAVLM